MTLFPGQREETKVTQDPSGGCRCRLVALVVGVALLALATGCGGDRCGEPENWQQLPRIAFMQTSYVFSWVPHYEGWFMYRSGEVFKVFVMGESAEDFRAIEDDGVVTLAELERLQNGFDLRGSPVDPDTIGAMLGLVGAAAKGPFSEPQSGCRDCGSFQYHALVRDCEKQGYRLVLLDRDGEERVANQSAEAGRIVEWLDRVMPGHTGP